MTTESKVVSQEPLNKKVNLATAYKIDTQATRGICPKCHTSHDYSAWKASDTKRKGLYPNQAYCPGCWEVVNIFDVEDSATEHELNLYGANKIEHKVDWYLRTQKSDPDVLLMGVTFIPYCLSKNPFVSDAYREVVPDVQVPEGLQETHSNGTHIANLVLKVISEGFGATPGYKSLYSYKVVTIHVRRVNTKLMMLTDFDDAMDHKVSHVFPTLEKAVDLAAKIYGCEYIPLH